MARTRFPVTHREKKLSAAILFALTMLAVPSQSASALITGGEGNTPINDPGWPQGAAAIFNHPARIAWWEGPPFGGGQWHAEYRGDAKTFSAVLTDFAQLDVKAKRIVIHDGVGHSSWLNPNREPAKQDAAKMDWTFRVWQRANWERLRRMPADLTPPDVRDAEPELGPPAQIDVYTGGNLQWSDVAVPDGIELLDERLEAHGFMLTDGTVLEGRAFDLATKRPLAARTQLQRIEPQPQGGYRYTVVAEADADAQGRWVLKKAPEGWYRVVVGAEGYVPRVVGYDKFDGQPGWHSYPCGLAHSAPVSGRITDEDGKPLANVDVRITNVVAEAGGRYESPDEYVTKTDADGHFHVERVPAGKATVWVRKSGYCRPGLGHSITTPARNVALSMLKAARVRATVDFTGTDRPEGYIVRMEPEGGAKVGKWSGSGNIDAKNQISFDDVPPGRYVLQGQPNPSSGNQQSKPITIELKGGQTAEIALSAKAQ